MKKTCPSVDPKDGTKCGQPAGHYGRCSNGVGHRSWEYNVPQKSSGHDSTGGEKRWQT